MSGKQTRIFLDAKILIAAVKSPTGGSALVLEVCKGRNFRAVGTRKVLLEAQQNIRTKFSEEELIKFYREIASLDPEIVEPVTEEEIKEYAQIINGKDAPVLAAAVKRGAAILITLDRKHFMTPTIKQANLPIDILTPGDFLQRILRTTYTRRTRKSQVSALPNPKFQKTQNSLNFGH